MCVPVSVGLLSFVSVLPLGWVLGVVVVLRYTGRSGLGFVLEEALFVWRLSTVASHLSLVSW